MIKRSRLYFLIILSCLWAFACSPSPDTSSTTQETRQVSATGVQARDFAPGQLEAHFAKHGYQFGQITAQEYLARARALLNSPADNQDVLEKTRANGDILHFRPSTGEFAVMTASGRIRTYFKTDQRYWMRQ